MPSYELLISTVDGSEVSFSLDDIDPENGDSSSSEPTTIWSSTSLTRVLENCLDELKSTLPTSFFRLANNEPGTMDFGEILKHNKGNSSDCTTDLDIIKYVKQQWNSTNEGDTDIEAGPVSGSNETTCYENYGPFHLLLLFKDLHDISEENNEEILCFPELTRVRQWNDIVPDFYKTVKFPDSKLLEESRLRKTIQHPKSMVVRLPLPMAREKTLNPFNSGTLYKSIYQMACSGIGKKVQFPRPIQGINSEIKEGYLRDYPELFKQVKNGDNNDWYLCVNMMPIILEDLENSVPPPLQGYIKMVKGCKRGLKTIKREEWAHWRKKNRGYSDEDIRESSDDGNPNPPNHLTNIERTSLAISSGIKGVLRYVIKKWKDKTDDNHNKGKKAKGSVINNKKTIVFLTVDERPVVAQKEFNGKNAGLGTQRRPGLHTESVGVRLPSLKQNNDANSDVKTESNDVGTATKLENVVIDESTNNDVNPESPKATTRKLNNISPSTVMKKKVPSILFPLTGYIPIVSVDPIMNYLENVSDTAPDKDDNIEKILEHHQEKSKAFDDYIMRSLLPEDNIVERIEKSIKKTEGNTEKLNKVTTSNADNTKLVSKGAGNHIANYMQWGGCGSGLTESQKCGGIFTASNVRNSTRIYNSLIENPSIIGKHGDCEHLRDVLEGKNCKKYRTKKFDVRASKYLERLEKIEKGISVEEEEEEKGIDIEVSDDEEFAEMLRNPSKFLNKGFLNYEVRRVENEEGWIDLEENELCWMTDRTPHESLPLEVGSDRQFFRLVMSELSVWFEDHNTRNPLGVVPDPEITTVVKGSK